MEEEKQQIKISVRRLVEFILQQGDIDSRMGQGLNKEAMQLGTKIHRKIQRRMGSDYHAEVPLKINVDCEEFDLLIEGRADGIIINDEGVTIDEIKGIMGELHVIEQPVPVHLAQAKCYAYIYGKEKTLGQVSVQMTYCQMETEEIKRFTQTYGFRELQEWFLELANQYKKWAAYQIEWRNIRNQSVKQVEFPFAYREGQRNLTTSVYKTILRKKNLFIQAPTGVGKTMACIFPAVKAIGEGLGDKIFYLTAKTITRTVAEQAFQTLKEQRLKMKTITLTAKEKICFCEETVCNPECCSYAKGHYDRVNDAVYDMITTTDEMTREALEVHARKHNVCPFEMALDVSLWVDAVICDYNYVFDPTAHLKRFFSEGVPGEYLFLVDEAHNLVDRGREMYSAVLYKEEFLTAKTLVKSSFPKLAKKLDECNKVLLELKRECESYQVHESIAHFYLKLMNVFTEMETFMEECHEEEKKEALLQFYFDISHFLNMYEKLDENYVIYTELEQDGRFKLKLFCVNPAVNLQEYLDYGNSTVFFSATLLPIQYYKRLLSSKTDDYAIYAESSFSKENRLLLIGKDVSTKYTRRGESMYQAFAKYIASAVKAKQGNYMVFFPSYRFMESVYEPFAEMVHRERMEVSCVLQTQSMNEGQREEFLQEFEENREENLVGFCVMGGIFSEGIDLSEDRLIGAVIAGTGLPQVCCERELLKDYFDANGGGGFDYAYLYPGMNKVLQAAGRVIRTEEDKGVILLLDDRFSLRQYTNTFPREWEGIGVCNVSNVQQKIETFWED